MDYEKKYNEALKRAKAAIDIAADKDLVKGVATTIFPELRESEEEKIRMWLIDCVKAKHDCYFETVTREQVLSYLEKQKESLHISESCKENADSLTSDEPTPSVILDEQGRVFATQQKEQKSAWSEEDEEALNMCLDVIPKKWKTKSGILLTKWLKDNIHLQPKQEWSEEDEKMKVVENEKPVEHLSVRDEFDLDGNPKQKPAEYCDDVVEEAEEYTSKVDCGEYGVAVTEAYIAGVLSERNRKPVEWSEEDENKIMSIKSLITTGRYVDTNTIRIIWDMLDSLHPQPHWKPSEEHLSALLAVFNDPDNIGSATCQLALTDLYEQLKQL